MPHMDSLSLLIGAAQSAGEAGARGLPPVHLWNPAHCGEIDIVIRRDGLWLHEGTPIGRPQLVRLFSTVLRRDPDGFYLVTPVEKLKIRVEDAPFVAVRVDRRGDELVFTTNVGDEVTAGAEHAIRVEAGPGEGEPRPYLHVRAELDALIARPVFYELVDMARMEEGRLTVTSDGAVFGLGALEAS
jgi:hypothetical protein